MLKSTLCVLAMCSSVALAQDHAIVNKEFGCGGFVPNDTPDGAPWLGNISSSEGNQAVMTPSGNQKLTCHFDHDVDLKKATSARGFGCATTFGYTELTKMTATPGGKAVLTCWVKAND